MKPDAQRDDQRADPGSPRSLVLNFAAYQVGWFACVLGAAYGWGTGGAAIAIALACAHVAAAERPEREATLVLAVGGIGLVADSLHAGLGILEFCGHQAGNLAPIWVVALWLQFGTILHFCLRWLSTRYALASGLGLVGGPLAFLGGERLGAAAFGEPKLLSLALLGLSWAILLPLLVALGDRLDANGRYRLFKRAAGARV